MERSILRLMATLQKNTVLGISEKALNVLVICYHARPLARQRAGNSRGNEQGFDQSFATAVRVKCLGFALYRHKGPSNEKIAGCGGKQQWFCHGSAGEIPVVCFL